MNLKQAEQRIAELERRIKELEARPEQHIHHHYHPDPTKFNPVNPYPQPWLPMPPVWCGSGVQGKQTGDWLCWNGSILPEQDRSNDPPLPF